MVCEGKTDEYSRQAEQLYGKTDAYGEFRRKQTGRTKEQERALGEQVMERFAALGRLRPCPPDIEAAQSWAKELQAFFTEHFYTCTPPDPEEPGRKLRRRRHHDGKHRQSRRHGHRRLRQAGDLHLYPKAAVKN